MSQSDELTLSPSNILICSDLLDSDFENQKEWGIVGCGLFSARKRQVLEKQDWLQTIIKRDADSVSARVIGSMTDYLPVDTEKREFIDIRNKLEDPSIKIVSMTVTEGGKLLLLLISLSLQIYNIISKPN